MIRITAQAAALARRAAWVFVLGCAALAMAAPSYAGSRHSKSAAEARRVAKDAAGRTASDLRLVIVPDQGVLLAFSTMYGVDGPFVGDGHPVRGVVGDELPWTIKSAVGALDEEGHLVLRVRGLVFADDPSVPPELRGINDESQFRALVSCVSEAPTDTPVANVVTAGFPATPSGNADIVTTIELPNPCVEPLVMVLAGSEDKWFAVTGVETEEEE